MAFADVTKYNLIRSMKGLPVGSIIPWASDQSTIPPGWTACNGATISSETYPLLFKVIGNVYGGTAGSTFKLPPLTQGGPAIVDQHGGHYNMLSDSKYQSGIHGPNEAHDIEGSNNIDEDPYWNIVGKGDNNDTGNNTQTFWISTLDLVGEEQSTATKFQAIYDEIEIDDGSYFFQASYKNVTLGVEHLPSHNHADPSTDSTSYGKSSATMSRCTGTVPAGSPCKMNCNSTSAYRVAASPAMHDKVSYGNNQTDLKANFKFVESRTGWEGFGGGGAFLPNPAYGQTNSSHYFGGDGYCSGDMGCGSDILFTSVSHDARTKSDAATHTHSTNTYELEGKYNVIMPGLRTDIKLNTVKINNSPGINYGTINVESSTPSLEMLYIIRAF